LDVDACVSDGRTEVGEALPRPVCVVGAEACEHGFVVEPPLVVGTTGVEVSAAGSLGVGAHCGDIAPDRERGDEPWRSGEPGGQEQAGGGDGLTLRSAAGLEEPDRSPPALTWSNGGRAR
jgi:hypothetical protein